MVVARAILGEWLGGSGGGWQDSGGVFPGVKVIQGVPAARMTPSGASAGAGSCPRHELLDAPGETTARPAAFHGALAESLVLVHGGMAQNVGPILNMVTEKYLLRSGPEWVGQGRGPAASSRRSSRPSKAADVRELGRLTTANWEGPLKGIVPWVSNRFTESIIAEAKAALGDDFWGFLMLGGMSGGGMGFFVAPHRRDAFRVQVGAIMARVKAGLDDALPFAMKPVVYDFKINPGRHLRRASHGADASMPPRYYTLQVPRMIAEGADALGPLAQGRRRPLRQPLPGRRRVAPRLPDDDQQPLPRHPVRRRLRRRRLGSRRRGDPRRERLRPRPARAAPRRPPARADRPGPQPPARRHRHPRRGRRRPDPRLGRPSPARPSARGEAALRNGEVAVVSLAAGVGSRWTTGAGVVKAVNPFVDARRPPPLVPGTAPGQDPQGPTPSSARRSRTSSRPAS